MCIFVHRNITMFTKSWWRCSFCITKTTSASPFTVTSPNFVEKNSPLSASRLSEETNTTSQSLNGRVNQLNRSFVSISSISKVWSADNKARLAAAAEMVRAAQEHVIKENKVQTGISAWANLNPQLLHILQQSSLHLLSDSEDFSFWIDGND